MFVTKSKKRDEVLDKNAEARKAAVEILKSIKECTQTLNQKIEGANIESLRDAANDE